MPLNTPQTRAVLWKTPNALLPQPSHESVQRLFTLKMKTRLPGQAKDQLDFQIFYFKTFPPPPVPERRAIGAGQMSHWFSISVKLPLIGGRVWSDVGGRSLIFCSSSPHHDTDFYRNHRFGTLLCSFQSVEQPLCWPPTVPARRDRLRDSFYQDTTLPWLGGTADSR